MTVQHTDPTTEELDEGLRIYIAGPVYCRWFDPDAPEERSASEQIVRITDTTAGEVADAVVGAVRAWMRVKRLAADSTAVGVLGDVDNEHGVSMSVSRCSSCGRVFTITPAVPESERDDWSGCNERDCGSYDVNRDVDALIGLGMAELHREELTDE